MARPYHPPHTPHPHHHLCPEPGMTSAGRQRGLMFKGHRTLHPLSSTNKQGSFDVGRVGHSSSMRATVVKNVCNTIKDLSSRNEGESENEVSRDSPELFCLKWINRMVQKRAWGSKPLLDFPITAAQGRGPLWVHRKTAEPRGSRTLLNFI